MKFPEFPGSACFSGPDYLVRGWHFLDHLDFQTKSDALSAFPSSRATSPNP